MALFNVSSIADLATLSATAGDIAFVADNDRTSGNPFQLIVSTTLVQNDGTVYAYPSLSNGYWTMLFDGSINVRWFGAKGDNSHDDTNAIQKAIDYAHRSLDPSPPLLQPFDQTLLFPSGEYLLTESIILKSGLAYYFNGCIFHAHFNDFAVKLDHPGGQTLIGKFSVVDKSVSSSADVITGGVAFGYTGRSVHHVNATACSIYCEGLKQAFFLEQWSYSNELGNLEAYNCGKQGTDPATYKEEFAFFMQSLPNDPVGGGANDILINSLRIHTDDFTNWLGKGAYIDCLGIVINKLHLEHINDVGAIIHAKGLTVNGGYIEVHFPTGVPDNWNRNKIYIENGVAVFNGGLINADVSCTNGQVQFNSCKFLAAPLNLSNMSFRDCGLVSMNLLRVAPLTNLKQLPQIDNSYPVDFSNFSGNWDEFGEGYTYDAATGTGLIADYDFYGGAHALSISGESFSGKTSLKFLKTGDASPTPTYSGGIGFKFPEEYINQQVCFWAIVKIVTPSGVPFNLKVGVGGLVGEGNFEIDSIGTVYTYDQWVLVVMPFVNAFRNYAFFEPNDGGEGGKSYFLIDSMGIEVGGIQYHNLNPRTQSKLNQFRKNTIPPLTGQWAVGDVFTNPAPGLKGALSYTCVEAGTPGNWRPLNFLAPGLGSISSASLIKIDFNGPRFQQLTLNSNVTITGSLNIIAGADLMIRFTGDVTSRTLTFPAQWKIYSVSSSYTVPANGVAFLKLFSFGTTDNEIIAEFLV